MIKSSWDSFEENVSQNRVLPPSNYPNIYQNVNNMKANKIFVTRRQLENKTKNPNRTDSEHKAELN